MVRTGRGPRLGTRLPSAHCRCRLRRKPEENPEKSGKTQFNGDRTWSRQQASPRLRFGALLARLGARKLCGKARRFSCLTGVRYAAYLLVNRHRAVEKDELIAALAGRRRHRRQPDPRISVIRRALGTMRRTHHSSRRFRGAATGSLPLSKRSTRPGPTLRNASSRRAPAPLPVGGIGPNDGALTASRRQQSHSCRLRRHGVSSGRGRGPRGIRSHRQAAPPGTAIVSGGVVSPTGRHLAFVAQDNPGKPRYGCARSTRRRHEGCPAPRAHRDRSSLRTVQPGVFRARDIAVNRPGWASPRTSRLAT